MTEYALRYALLHLRDVGRETEARTLSQDETLRRRRIKLGLSSLFLSYARGDDDAFVLKLHHDLTTRGFDVWFDREALPGKGRTFLREVRQAIDEYDRLVLVVGPNALKSDLSHRRMAARHQQRQGCHTVLRTGDYADLPEELRQHHVLDVRDDVVYTTAISEFVRLVTAPLPPLGPLFGVPPIPPHFVARSQIMRELTNAVLGLTSLWSFPVRGPYV